MGVDYAHEASHLSCLVMPAVRPSMGAQDDHTTQTVPKLQKPLLANQATGHGEKKVRTLMTPIPTSGFAPAYEGAKPESWCGLGGEQKAIDTQAIDK